MILKQHSEPFLTLFSLLKDEGFIRTTSLNSLSTSLDQYNLSYIIVTRNRLPFLKITLERLIDEVQPDEEIIVVDGNSSDGASEYLQQLYSGRKIHQFLSEPDMNQAHGWNKAMLMAKGTIIKKIIDDDVFCYQSIRKCKDYMLKTPQIDVLISNDLGSSIDNYQHIQKQSRLSQFEKWKKGMVASFTFSDVHMLIRRSSLAHIGLYNISYTMMDWEYSLRISFLKAGIAFYTGYNALNVAHPQTVTSSQKGGELSRQSKRAEIFYEYKGDRADISYWSEFKIFAGKILNYNKDKSNNSPENKPEFVDLNVIYDHFYTQINSINEYDGFVFL